VHETLRFDAIAHRLVMHVSFACGVYLCWNLRMYLDQLLKAWRHKGRDLGSRIFADNGQHRLVGVHVHEWRLASEHLPAHDAVRVPVSVCMHE